MDNIPLGRTPIVFGHISYLPTNTQKLTLLPHLAPKYNASVLSRSVKNGTIFNHLQSRSPPPTIAIRISPRPTRCAIPSRAKSKEQPMPVKPKRFLWVIAYAITICIARIASLLLQRYQTRVAPPYWWLGNSPSPQHKQIPSNARNTFIQHSCATKLQ